MLRKLPAQLQETSELRPRGVSDKQSVRLDVERRRRFKLVSPQPDGANVPELVVQHMRDHAQRSGEAAGSDLVFEIANDDLAKASVPVHDSDCLRPMMRSKQGCSSCVIR